MIMTRLFFLFLFSFYEMSLCTEKFDETPEEQNDELVEDSDLAFPNFDDMPSLWDDSDSPYVEVEREVSNGKEIPTTNFTDQFASKISESSSETSFLTIVKQLGNVTKDTGDSVRMKCEFQGNPMPEEISWFKNEAPLELERGKVDMKRYIAEGRIGSRIRISHLDTHDTGYYKCESTNGDHTVESSGILVVRAGRIHTPSLIPNFPPSFPHFPALGGRLPEFEQGDLGQCSVYRGVACSQLVGNKTVYIQAKSNAGRIEENLRILFTALATVKETSPECQKYAVTFFCLSLLSPCDDTIPYPSPREVCFEDCHILESSICRNEFMSVKQLLHKSYKTLLPSCSSPPKHQEGKSSLKDNRGSCTSLGIIKSAVLVDKEQTCYVGYGETYKGPTFHSFSGLVCQRWSEITDFTELNEDHNYCRNPKGIEQQPWCFVADPHIVREICDIPYCSNYSWLYVFLPVLAGVLVILLIAILWCRKRRRINNLAKQSPQSAVQLIPAQQVPKLLSSQQQLEMKKFLPRIPICIHELPANSIRYLHELGEGTFGKVYRGEITFPGTGAGINMSHVVVKTLRENASTQMRQEFCRAIESSAAIQHPNIVCLLAVNLVEEPMSMIFEYMFQCDLHEYLLLHSPHSDIAVTTEDGTPHILETADFLSISVQVSSAMEFLSGKRYVHRDLAARNCLVVSDPTLFPISQSCKSTRVNLSTINDLVVKISDLGMSRNSCAPDYCRIRNILSPVRWMAPESLLYGSFTTETDVWSFGVLLWEIFNYGIQPYFSFDNQDVIELVCTHQILPRPDCCPSYVYSIMKDCWQETPSHRPTFEEIHNRLTSIRDLHERSFSMSHSVLTHNSSHPSSTGPSNKTLSTNISGGTTGPSTPNSGGLSLSARVPLSFVNSKVVTGYRTHHCQQPLESKMKSHV